MLCRWWIFSSAIIWLLSGCVALPRPAEQPKVVSPKAGANFPNRIAIAPFTNQSGNPDAGLVMRALVQDKLTAGCGFNVLPPSQTDDILRSRTSDEPDLPLIIALEKIDPKVLAPWLGVDGVMHGQIYAYSKDTLMGYERTHVKARFWLTGSTGQTLWEGSHDSDHGGLGGTASIDALLGTSGVSPDVLDRIHRSGLAEPAMDVIENAFASFPHR